jgi:predicted nucleic acid-binding protein
MNNVVSVAKQDIEKAMTFSEFNDLEDALQLQSLKKVKGNFIITRDEKFQRLSDEAILSRDFVQRVLKSFKDERMPEL